MYSFYINDFCLWNSQREIRLGEEISWYADEETIVRNEHTASIAYAYGMIHYSDACLLVKF